MDKPLSKSQALAAKVMYATLCLLRDKKAPTRGSELLDAVGEQLSMDDWAREIMESNGLPRWRMYAHFFSVDAVKTGYLIKNKGVWTLTPEGVKVLDLGEREYFLKAQQGYRAWKATQVAQAGAKVAGVSAGFDDVEDAPPEVRLQEIQREVQTGLAAEILENIKACSPAYFERLVVQLLITMGYGGSREEAGRAVGRSGDGGIDGVINEDRLGLDAIYLQAKRWSNGTVGRPEIQQFVGALAGRRASKGVFITTSHFSQEAKDYAAASTYKVVLIDGERLANLMIDHGLGVSVVATYQLKRVDTDFFLEE